jgi:hypothetical protein
VSVTPPPPSPPPELLPLLLPELLPLLLPELLPLLLPELLPLLLPELLPLLLPELLPLLLPELLPLPDGVLLLEHAVNCAVATAMAATEARASERFMGIPPRLSVLSAKSVARKVFPPHRRSGPEYLPHGAAAVPTFTARAATRP